MANKFQIEITGRDKTGAAIKSVNDNFDKLARGTPLDKVNRAFRGIQDKGKAFGGIARSFTTLGDSAKIAGGGIEEAAGGLGALGAAAGVAGLVTVGVGVALGEAANKAYQFEKDFSAAGATVGRTAAAIGISTYQLQQFQLAGQRAGVSAEAMSEALTGIGTAMQDAVSGRNQDALALINKLHIQVHRLKDGSIDSARGMLDLSVAMKNSNPETQRMLVSIFGVAGALNFMKESSRQQQAQLAAAAASGAIKTDQQIKDETRFQVSIAATNEKWHALLNTFSERLIIPWLQPTVDEIGKLLGYLDQLLGGGAKANAAIYRHQHALWGVAGLSPLGVAAGALSDPGGVFGDKLPGGKGAGASSPIGATTAALSDKGKQALAFFQSQGWTPAQAAGIVANLATESGFNTHAVGDSGRALGIAQWHPDRQAAFAQLFGHSVGMASFEEQLKFVQYELTQGVRKFAGDHLRHAQDAATAGATVSKFYEGPRDVQGEMNRRAALADHIVHVEINMKNAPPTTTVVARSSSPRVTTGATVTPSLAGASV
jgi:hypothetical protein